MLFMTVILVLIRCSEVRRVEVLDDRERPSESGCHEVSECNCGGGEEGAVEATAIIYNPQARLVRSQVNS